ncbi:MAG: hypothetical protein Q4F54_04700 [Coriobacteriia bacterium]|nr:hypothetical protein [Coriobacteriia bacterium]
MTISSESTTVPDIKLISGSTFTGNLTFSSYMPASYVTFSTADKQYVSFSNGDNYVLNVPTNIEGTLSVTPLVTDYNSPSCTIISAGAGEAIVQDFYLYREADLSKVNITIESQSSSSTYSLSYISDDKQFSIEEAGIAAGTHTYTVPPSTHGILKIVESVTGCVFIYGLDSAASGSSTTVSAIFRTFPTITAEVVDGTFIESKMPAFWSKESDTQYTTSKFIAGSTLDLCLQDIDKNAIATENLYYFKGIEHDPNVVLLTADTTVTFKCDHFISVKDKLYHKQD